MHDGFKEFHFRCKVMHNMMHRDARFEGAKPHIELKTRFSPCSAKTKNAIATPERVLRKLSHNSRAAQPRIPDVKQFLNGIP
jgi:hypothetical protein